MTWLTEVINISAVRIASPTAIEDLHDANHHHHHHGLSTTTVLDDYGDNDTRRRDTTGGRETT
jgi:hypothetical protein